MSQYTTLDHLLGGRGGYQAPLKVIGAEATKKKELKGMTSIDPVRDLSRECYCQLILQKCSVTHRDLPDSAQIILGRDTSRLNGILSVRVVGSF